MSADPFPSRAMLRIDHDAEALTLVVPVATEVADDSIAPHEQETSTSDGQSRRVERTRKGPAPTPLGHEKARVLPADLHACGNVATNGRWISHRRPPSVEPNYCDCSSGAGSCKLALMGHGALPRLPIL